MKTHKGPKILVFDIETSPITAHVWGLFNQNIGLEQIVDDWSVMAWAAKWLDSKKMMYNDTRKNRNLRNDKAIVKKMWNLFNEADVVITQNGKGFDVPKMNACFAKYRMKPPSSFKHIDILEINRKVFGFTSNKLEYVTNLLNHKYKKLKHKEFPGHSMWKECLNRNPRAWFVMEKYNQHDVLALEEAYHYLSAWSSSINLNVFHDDETHTCSCGSTKFTKNGYKYTAKGKFQRFTCVKCGKETRSSQNLFSKKKRDSLHMS